MPHGCVVVPAVDVANAVLVVPRGASEWMPSLTIEGDETAPIPRSRRRARMTSLGQPLSCNSSVPWRRRLRMQLLDAPGASTPSV